MLFAHFERVLRLCETDLVGVVRGWLQCPPRGSIRVKASTFRMTAIGVNSVGSCPLKRARCREQTRMSTAHPRYLTALDQNPPYLAETRPRYLSRAAC
jgi:hypothetical protein